MNRALAYTRVSTEEQGRSGFGLASQRAEIEAFSDAYSYKVVRWKRDVGSAIGGDSLAHRPGLQAILEEAKLKRLPVLISRLDRLSRDSNELEQLVRNSGVQFLSVNEHHLSDPLVLEVQSKRVARDTADLSKRTRDGMRVAKEEGRIFGNPTNLKEAQQLGAEANRQKFLDQCRELRPLVGLARAAGAKSMRAIADQLNDRGHRASSGKPWTGPNLDRYVKEIDSMAKAEDAQIHENNPEFGRF